jgi:NAD(P)-dependent dehydrogenase (short-subunit alcohol dehydrogenase family)
MAGQFSESSTTDDVLSGIDLTGKHVLITGVSAGLGIETARALVAHGADVVGTVRDLDKGQTAAKGLFENEPGSYRMIACDLASLASVRSCADALIAANEPFDVVIGNAGIMGCPLSHTADGFEMQFGVNHLGHFVLINRLVPLLKPGARVVALTSAGHRHADVDLEDPNFQKTPYHPFASYGRSKTANSLFAVEFDRRHRANHIRAAAVHPGSILTELGRHLSPEMLGSLSTVVKGSNFGSRPLQKNVAQGAATTVWAGFVARAEEIGGRYCEDCGVAAISENDANGRKGVRPYAVDPKRAEALWTLSESLVGERFNGSAPPQGT